MGWGFCLIFGGSIFLFLYGLIKFSSKLQHQCHPPWGITKVVNDKYGTPLFVVQARRQLDVKAGWLYVVGDYSIHTCGFLPWACNGLDNYIESLRNAKQVAGYIAFLKQGKWLVPVQHWYGVRYRLVPGYPRADRAYYDNKYGDDYDPYTGSNEIPWGGRVITIND